MSGPQPDFVAGNTRLRARLTQLRQLAGLESGPARRAAADQLLRELPSAYSPPARDAVAVLLARHDLADVIALLRGALHQHPPVFRLSAVRAVGRVTATAAADVAAADDGADAISRIVTLSLLGPAVATHVQSSWDSYELHQDTAQLEVDIASAAHHDWTARLTRAGRGGRAVAQLVAEERDLANLDSVLRTGSADPARLLPPGRVDLRALTATIHGDWAPLVRARPDWSAATRALGPYPGSVVVTPRLQALPTGRAAAQLRFGDHYTAEPAVGYALLVEDAARHQSVAGTPHPVSSDRPQGSPLSPQGEPWAVSS